MSGYREAIIEATGCDPADAGVIEELVRVEVPTLDHLDRAQFRRVARRGQKVMRELAETDPECLDFYRKAAT